jgi:predicted DNA-binding transcriptional regulator AlpA
MTTTPQDRFLVGSALVAPDEIVALTEIAEMLSVTRRTVQRYMDREDFPAPLGVLAGNRRVWRRDDVADWAERTLPLAEGRPRKEAGQ